MPLAAALEEATVAITSMSRKPSPFWKLKLLGPYINPKLWAVGRSDQIPPAGLSWPDEGRRFVGTDRGGEFR